MLHGQVLFHPLFGCFVGLHDARAERYLRGSETENPIRMISVVELKSKSVQKVCMIQLQNIVRIVGNWWNEIQINDDINMKILYQFYSNYKYTYIFSHVLFTWNPNKALIFWLERAFVLGGFFSPKIEDKEVLLVTKDSCEATWRADQRFCSSVPTRIPQAVFRLEKGLERLMEGSQSQVNSWKKFCSGRASWILERSMQGSLSCKLKAKIR